MIADVRNKKGVSSAHKKFSRNEFQFITSCRQLLVTVGVVVESQRT